MLNCRLAPPCKDHVTLVQLEEPPGAGDGVVQDGVKFLGAVAHSMTDMPEPLVSRTLVSSSTAEQGGRPQVEVADPVGFHEFHLHE
jgi:hypothetical protein